MKQIMLLLMVSLGLSASAQEGTKKGVHPGSDREVLKLLIREITVKYNATVGVAVLGIEDRDTLTLNNAHHYPMQSVYKFPLALKILDLVDIGKLSLEQKVHINKKDLHKTWSPLREKYPEGNIDMTVQELLVYTVGKSDNNTCDILFRLAGGTKSVDKYIHQLGVKNMAIAATELEMTKGWGVQYTNWAEPMALVRLLEGLYQQKYLSKSSNEVLMKIMTESENSEQRIKGLLPPGTAVAHKTGTSNKNEAGLIAATNDVGIITLPNGKHFAIAVFVSDGKESYETNEKIIAEITKVVYAYFSEK